MNINGYRRCFCNLCPCCIECFHQIVLVSLLNRASFGNGRCEYRTVVIGQVERWKWTWPRRMEQDSYWQRQTDELSWQSNTETWRTKGVVDAEINIFSWDDGTPDFTLLLICEMWGIHSGHDSVLTGTLHKYRPIGGSCGIHLQCSPKHETWKWLLP